MFSVFVVLAWQLSIECLHLVADQLFSYTFALLLIAVDVYAIEALMRSKRAFLSALSFAMLSLNSITTRPVLVFFRNLSLRVVLASPTPTQKASGTASI